MRSRRSFYMLLAVTLAAVIAAVLSRPAHEPAPTRHGLHAPALAGQAEAVQVVEIRTAADFLRLTHNEDGWLAANRGDYPADAGRVRQLVLGLSGLRRLERKTADPARHPRLGLGGVDTPGSRATRIDLLDGGGARLYAILVGDTQDFEANGRSRYFVRDAGDDQTWLVEGVLPPVLDELHHWLQQDLLAGVEAQDLRSLTVTRDGGKSLTVARDAAGSALTLAGPMDAGRRANRHAVDALADTFVGLSLKGFAGGEAAGQGVPVAMVEARTFDGLRVTAEIRRGEPDYLVRLAAEHQPGRAAAADSDAPPGGELLAQRLNERWRERWFVVSQYALDALLVARADLVEENGASRDP